MRYVPTITFALAVAGAAVAGDVRKVDPPPKAEWVTIPCDPVLTVFAAEKPGTWEVVDDHPAVCLRPHADGKGCSFAAPAGSSTRVIVTTAGGVQRLRLVVPGPPDPMPPAPGPTPPPAPVDPLVRKLQSAYTLDARPAAERDADRLDLIELYRQAADLAGQAEVATTAALVQRIQAAAKALGVDGLVEVRRAIAAEVAGQLGTDDAPLTADSRAKAAAVFTRIHNALKEVK